MATAGSLMPILNENVNFSHWKFRLKVILEEKQISHVLNEAPEGKEELIQFTKDDARAKSTLVQCVGDKYLDIIKQSKTTSEMLTSLEAIFERKTVCNKFYLKRKLITLRYETESNLQQYFLKFEGILGAN